MKNSKDYVRSAWQRLKRQWKEPVVAIFILLVAMLPIYLVDFYIRKAFFPLETPNLIKTFATYPLDFIYTALIVAPVSWGVAVFILKWIRLLHFTNVEKTNTIEEAFVKEDVEKKSDSINDSTAKYSDIFLGFSDYARIMVTKLLVNIYTIGWTLLFVIPGCVKYYAYSMTDYLLFDHPDLTKNAAIEQSMKMMQGKKAKLFTIDLLLFGIFLILILVLSMIFVGILIFFKKNHVDTSVGMVIFYAMLAVIFVLFYSLSPITHALFYNDLVFDDSLKDKEQTTIAREVNE